MLHGNSSATLTYGTAVHNLAFIRVLPLVIVAVMYVQTANRQFPRYDDPSCVTDKSRVSSDFTACSRYLSISYVLCSALANAVLMILPSIVQQQAAAGTRRD